MKALGPAPYPLVSATRKTIGEIGEDLALSHYQRLGFSTVERNARTRHGEIDLIVRRAGRLVICEVRTVVERGSTPHPFESIGPAKRRQVRRMAAWWLADRGRAASSGDLRLDAVGIRLDRSLRLLELTCLEGVF